MLPAEGGEDVQGSIGHTTLVLKSKMGKGPGQTWRQQGRGRLELALRER